MCWAVLCTSVKHKNGPPKKRLISQDENLLKVAKKAVLRPVRHGGAKRSYASVPRYKDGGLSRSGEKKGHKKKGANKKKKKNVVPRKQQKKQRLRALGRSGGIAAGNEESKTLIAASKQKAEERRVRFEADQKLEERRRDNPRRASLRKDKRPKGICLDLSIFVCFRSLNLCIWNHS